MTTTSVFRKRFTDPRAWSGGGSHTLSLCYQGSSSDRVLAARDALWTCPRLEGCWPRRDREPSAASRLGSTWGLDLDKPLYGVAHVPGSGGIACSARGLPPARPFDEPCPCCEALGLHEEPPIGWLNLDLPLGGLGLAFPIGRYPVADGTSLAWRDGVDAWLRAVAEHVHRAAPFDLGIVGWECLVPCPLPRRPEEIPAVRGAGWLLPGQDGLAWFPPALGAPIDEDWDLDFEPEPEQAAAGPH